MSILASIGWSSHIHQETLRFSNKLRHTTRDCNHISRLYVSLNNTLRGFANGPLSRHAYDPSRIPQPSEETQDVTAIDKHMKFIRERSNPVYRSLWPMRSPLSWTETISSTSLSAAQHSTPASIQESKLSPRTMGDSYSELVLPFGSKPDLLEQYINAGGSIRVGKLIEHLDSLAGSIAYKHVLDPGEKLLGDLKKRGFFIVTAAVDRLDMLTPLNQHNLRDMRLCGHVVHTGRSSMEVAVKIELLGGQEETVMLGRFSMVCRDAFTQKAKPIPPLELSTPEEVKLFNMGAANKERKMSLALQSLTKVPPSTEEAAELHELYLNYGQDNPPMSHTERMWMQDTCLENCILMFPQERNVHSKIFGGYLMRLAYELSFTTAALFSRRPLRFLSLDGLSFRHPVPIGSILRLRSQVALTAQTDHYPALVHITVRADVVDVKTGTEMTTNDFRFTWCDEHGPPLDRRVVPNTYHDAMEWIEAKRALNMGNAIRNLRDIQSYNE